MHHHLKVICAEDSVPMNAFVTKAIEREFVEREERIDEKAVDQAEKDIKKHGTISLKEFKKRLGI
jgi:ribosomal protein S25